MFLLVRCLLLLLVCGEFVFSPAFMVEFSQAIVSESLKKKEKWLICFYHTTPHLKVINSHVLKLV